MLFVWSHSLSASLDTRVPAIIPVSREVENSKIETNLADMYVVLIQGVRHPASLLFCHFRSQRFECSQFFLQQRIFLTPILAALLQRSFADLVRVRGKS